MIDEFACAYGVRCEAVDPGEGDLYAIDNVELHLRVRQRNRDRANIVKP